MARSIDKLRDGAGSIEINTPDDDSEISEMISFGEKLLIVKGKGVYEVKLADQVDPERTNVATPNTLQRIFPYGTDDPWVGATLLTGYRLLKGQSAQDTVDGDEAFALVLEIVKEISGAHQLQNSYTKAETESTAKFEPKTRPDRSIIVPAIGNVETRCNEFLQRGDHALRELFLLVRMFYPDVGSGGWDGLKKKIDSGPQNIDDFQKFLADFLPFLHLGRNARNCVEHPRREQRLSVTDFELDTKNTLLPPMIEIQHPRTPLAKIPVGEFFSQYLQNLSKVVELMIVFICARHVKPFGGMSIKVMEIPPERRKSPPDVVGL